MNEWRDENFRKTWNLLPLSKEVWESLLHFSDKKHTHSSLKARQERVGQCSFSAGGHLSPGLLSEGTPGWWHAPSGAPSLYLNPVWPPRAGWLCLETHGTRNTLNGKTPKATVAMVRWWVWCMVGHPIISKDTGQMTEVGRAGFWPGKNQWVVMSFLFWSWGPQSLVSYMAVISRLLLDSCHCVHQAWCYRGNSIEIRVQMPEFQLPFSHCILCDFEVGTWLLWTLNS